VEHGVTVFRLTVGRFHLVEEERIEVLRRAPMSESAAEQLADSNPLAGA